MRPAQVSVTAPDAGASCTESDMQSSSDKEWDCPYDVKEAESCIMGFAAAPEPCSDKEPRCCLHHLLHTSNTIITRISCNDDSVA